MKQRHLIRKSAAVLLLLPSVSPLPLFLYGQKMTTKHRQKIPLPDLQRILQNNTKVLCLLQIRTPTPLA